MSPGAQRALAMLLTLSRLGLAGVFLYAGALKALDPAGFAQEIANYRLLPEVLVGVAAVGLPPLELATGAALLAPGYRAGGALLSGAMLLGFAFAMGQARLRGIDLECGCFGAGGGSEVSWSKVALDLGLAMLSFWVLRMELRRPAGDPQPEPEPLADNA